MCDRITIKKHAKEDMKHHYFRNVFVTFICFIILSRNGFNIYVIVRPYSPHIGIYSKHIYFPILYFLLV